MSLNIAGTLYNPIGSIMGDTQIRITTVASEYVLPETSAVITTGSNGEYDFTLFNGTYFVEILQKDEYTLDREIVVDSETTTGPVTLVSLLI